MYFCTVFQYNLKQEYLMQNNKGLYQEDVERNRIFTVALIYDHAADKLAPWDAAAAEECYQKKIDLLTPLAPVSFGLAETQRKLAVVQEKQGKNGQAEATRKRYEEMKQQLSEMEEEVRSEHPELAEYVKGLYEELFAGLGVVDIEHDMQLAIKYKQALNSSKYPYDYFPELCDFFSKRRICLCVGNPVGGILITGINPSRKRFAEDKEFAYTFRGVTVEEKQRKGKITSPYWRQKYKMLGKELINETAYLDLYPLGFTSQDGFEDLIEKNYEFRAAIVSITQREIETHIMPKLIIVANKQSSYYWGRNEDATWMGYDMERISDDIELYQIRGFKDRPDRLNPDLKESALSGSLILFYGMYDERSKDKLLSENDFKQLYEQAKVKKKEWELSK